jgi:DNA-binding response OmpR family regulator
MADPYRVAVVESDADVRSMLAEVLGESAFEVIVVADRRSLPASWRGDVIITDTFRSAYRVHDAVALVRGLRARYGASIIVLTGHSEIMADADEIAADAVVMKPFELESFVALIGTLARGARQRKTGSVTSAE